MKAWGSIKEVYKALSAKNKGFFVFTAIFYIPVFLLQIAIVFFYFYAYAKKPDADELLRQLALQNPQGFLTVLAIVFLNIVYIVVLLIILNSVYKKHVQSVKDKMQPFDLITDAGKGKVEALIVKKSDSIRNEKFNLLNSAVKSKYSVYGIGLTSLSEQEDLLERFIDEKINVRLCMANPNIFREIICKENIVNGYCEITEHIKKREAQFDKGDIIKWIDKSCGFSSDLLCKYDVLVKQSSLREYIKTPYNYYENISLSFHNIVDLIRKVDKSDKHGRISFKKVNSFIPLSITIADEESDNGQMIVEYLLPYTNERLMIHIMKSVSPVEFASFVSLFNQIYEYSDNVASNKAND